ncbi:MAG: SRPBCC family protein [Chitinophagaceae bacterium]|nr:SRPBCC family protein [Chitinophagaceae bacterium]
MTCIELETVITAPVEICFDLSRSIELHQISTASTKEKAIHGRTTGLCEKGDTITWRAKHFGIYQQLTVQISEMNIPVFFEDRMVSGAFRSMRHRHYFTQTHGITLMKDIFEYEVPARVIGRIFDYLVLKNYMITLLLKRNQTIKDFAEGDWQAIL